MRSSACFISSGVTLSKFVLLGVLFDCDEHPRSGTTKETLMKLRPAFKEKGSVTAGNSSGVNDGASAVVVMSAKEAEKRELEVMAYIVDYQVSGVDPNIMGIGPVPAVQ
jgi:acetyl-CoA C-acetyltransferase